MEPIFKFVILGIILCCCTSYTVQLNREWFTNEPCGPDLLRCRNAQCTRVRYRCDGDYDCRDHSDETQCHIPLTEHSIYQNIKDLKEKSSKWLIDNVANISVYNDWDYSLARTAVALYLANETGTFAPGNTTGKKIASLLELQMLDKLAQRGLEDMPTTELALYVHAFLVSCLNPRGFHGHDLVVELRVRSNTPRTEYANPYALLALCNAGEPLTDSDIVNLVDVFRNEGKRKRDHWFDMRAYALMALSCVSVQNPRNMTSYAAAFNTMLTSRNAKYSLDIVKTTALIMQGYISTNWFPPEPSSRSRSSTKHFNAKPALDQLIRVLKYNNGSMDRVRLLYYLVPVLSYKSLVNITFSHCNHQQAAATPIPLVPKKTVKYSLWFGMDKYAERSMIIRVNATAKFKTVMDMAAEMDSTYGYKSTNATNAYPNHVFDSTIYSISGTEEDPENDRFWFFYRVTNNLATELVRGNPLEYNPADKEHLLFWLRKGPYAVEE